ncbi:MAG: CYTH domain-containing protein [Oscillospiraceae bacterium]|nr:CYTH domain-containing protein [Oscillospiraceae bacterium]
MGREFELKYAAAPSQLEALKARYPHLRPISMETTYYDTPDGALSKVRWTLRRRMENGVSICTLKTPLPDGSRGEWEVECSNIQDGIDALFAAGAPKALLLYTVQGVQEVCAARFTRLAGLIRLDGCTVELALDEGCLLGGGKELPLCEAEVELKDGDENLAVAFAERLASEFGLKPEPKSKYRRALGLARGER